MYKSVTLSNFKCFDSFKLNGLKRINLVTGLNNVGKTALLEAFFLNAGSFNPKLPLQLLSNRGLEKFKLETGKWFDAPWLSLFSNYDSSASICINGKLKNGKTIALELSIAKQPLERDLNSLTKETISNYSTISDLEHINILRSEVNYLNATKRFDLIQDPTRIIVNPAPISNLFPCYFLSPELSRPSILLSSLFGEMQKRGKEKYIEKALKFIEPRLKELIVIVENGEPMIQGNIGLKRFLPLSLMGDGIVRLASTILFIANASEGLVLLDEIETGIHYSMQNKLWEIIDSVSKDYNVQIIASSHSFECIKAAHDVFSKSNNYDFNLIRLEKKENRISPVIYDKNKLESSISFGFEVR